MSCGFKVKRLYIVFIILYLNACMMYGHMSVCLAQWFCTRTAVNHKVPSSNPLPKLPVFHTCIYFFI